ncbi:SLAF1 protein, partial [Hylia prasina]|nr:SLAF1 protein [Hylia prasina]
RKKFLLRLSGGNYTELEPGRLRFHSRDFSLEILNTSRDDQRLYEFSVSKGEEEEVWQVQLDVFERVSRAGVRVLARDVSNGSCRLALRCTAERGDRVSFSWAGRDNGSAGICSGAGAFLNVSYPPRAEFGCVCTARNAVSSGRAAFLPPQCGA